MAEERVQRRLAAILAADVVGYSRLIEQDEAGTLTALKERRKSILQPLVAHHDGRVVKVMGDGVLVEFASAVNAVACAVELQKKMTEAGANVQDSRRVVLRIGINLGDVIVEAGDLYGDGVIIAVRLQEMAEPGDILIADNVHNQVEKKIALAYEDLGTREIKNMARPIHVFRISVDNSPSPALANSDNSNPSIAILPFTNMSGDPEQQYFSDGITEDIITELSRFRAFTVIARHSSFQFRDSAADVKRVGRELGVRYVVEGSVRRVGDNIRITAQLIDAIDGVHLWAERYDRSASEIFTIQQDVVQAIVGTFAGRLEHAARERARRRPTNSLAAYECFLRAHDDVWRLYYDTESYLREGLVEARRLCERAIELDPRYARAYACLGAVHLWDWLYRGAPDDLNRAVSFARTAVGIDDADDWCHATLGMIHLKRAEHDLAEFHMRRAIELNPNDADTYCNMGLYLVYVGLPLQAIERLQKAMQRNPFCPDYYPEVLGMAYYSAHRFEEGVASLRRMRKLPSWGRAYLAACYAQLGRLEEARAETAEYIREARVTWSSLGADHADPLTTLIGALDTDLRTHKNAADYQLWLDGMRKAGLPI